MAFRFIFDPTDAEPVDVQVRYISDWNPYADQGARLTVLKMVEGSVIQDGGVRESDGRIEMRGAYMAKATFDILWARYKTPVEQRTPFDVVDDLTGNRWRCVWIDFKPVPTFLMRQAGDVSFSLTLQKLGKVRSDGSLET